MLTAMQGIQYHKFCLVLMCLQQDADQSPDQTDENIFHTSDQNQGRTQAGQPVVKSGVPLIVVIFEMEIEMEIEMEGAGEMETIQSHGFYSPWW